MEHVEHLENFGSWSVLTTNFLIVLFLALNGVTLSSVLHLCNAKWRFNVRYLACSTAGLFAVAGVLLVILLAFGENTFQWLATAHDGEHHLNGWHNYSFLVARQIGGFLLIVALFGLFIKYQYESSIDSSYAAQRRFRNIALLIPFAYFIYGTMIAWDFEMTMRPGWHSASYGAYHFQSNFHMYLAFLTVFLFFMTKAGVIKDAIPDHIFNKLAQFMLGMTILWTYLYFTQYLIMWYGRFPHETSRFMDMMNHDFSGQWWLFLALKFIIPFATLVINPNRHNPPVIAFVACSILLGTWIERYTWVAGSVDTQYYHVPMTSLMDIVYTVIVAAVSWVVVKKTLQKYALIKA